MFFPPDEARYTFCHDEKTGPPPHPSFIDKSLKGLISIDSEILIGFVKKLRQDTVNPGHLDDPFWPHNFLLFVLEFKPGTGRSPPSHVKSSSLLYSIILKSGVKVREKDAADFGVRRPRKPLALASNRKKVRYCDQWKKSLRRDKEVILIKRIFLFFHCTFSEKMEIVPSSRGPIFLQSASGRDLPGVQ